MLASHNDNVFGSTLLSPKTSTSHPKDDPMHSIWFGEFLGTFVLILLGSGVCASTSLEKAYAKGAGWIVVTAGWAFGVLCGVLTAQAFGSSGGHLNPAVTFAAAINSGDFSQLATYWSAQLLGAMAAAVVTWLIFYPHWAITPDPATKLGVFCTGPAIKHLPSNFLSEVAGTFVLVLVANAIGSHGVAPNGTAAGLAPLLVACLVWGIGLSLGSTTGYAINPARDFGPRIMHAILPIPEKGSSNFAYAWVPIVGDLTGAALAGALVHFGHL
jgi:glycerol uptake facilitator protein